MKLHIDKAAIDEAFEEITGDLSEQDRDDLAKRAAKMAVLVKTPERIRPCASDIVKHFQSKVEPNGFKAQVVTFDRECCVLYKKVLDELIGPEASAIVMTVSAGRPAGMEAARPRQGRRGEAARPLPRPGRPAEVRHRHRQAAHRLRRADPAGDVPRQADEGPHPAAGHLPHQPHLSARRRRTA